MGSRGVLRNAGQGQELQLTSCDQARDMSHVGEQIGVALVCNLPHAGVVVVPALTPGSAWCQHPRVPQAC